MWAGLGFVDALFEAMSGLTTTGATVLRDFGAVGRGLFFWRAMTQWLGGMGVIALFVAVLPHLAIGGRELFFSEASGLTDEKLTPQLRQTAGALWKLYATITAAQVLALYVAGMSLFDSVCQLDGDAGGRRVLSPPEFDRRLSEPDHLVDHRGLHVHRRRELRPTGEGDSWQPCGAAQGRGTPGVRRGGGGRVGGAVPVSQIERGRDGRRGQARGFSGGLDHHHHRVRQRRFFPMERSGQGRAAGVDVHRRVRGIGCRRAESHPARVDLPAAGPAGEAGDGGDEFRRLDRLGHVDLEP
ncbi:MAG: potassium transporter TrkG [Vicinamibacterales bacterium]